jgi:signal transduction histidine kinase
MLADGMVSSDDARRDYLTTLKTESHRLARIVENVLEYARLGRRRRVPQPVSLSELVERISPSLRRRVEQAGMSFELSMVNEQEGRMPFLAADPNTVEQILFNLVDNACKYGSESETKRVEVAVRAGMRDVSFTVRDFGPGVPDYEQGRIFRPFYRSEVHAHGSTPGLGLGLALAVGLAKELGGRLALDETISPGAAFRLVIPVYGW